MHRSKRRARNHPKLRTPRRRCALVAFALVAAASPALARPLAVPIRLDHAFLRQQLVTQVFDEPGERTPAWRDPSGCTSVVLSEPELSHREGALHVLAKFDARLGIGIGGGCLGRAERQGIFDATLEPRIAPRATAVAFRVVRSELHDPDGQKRLAGAVWDLARAQVHPNLERLQLDLGQPLADIAAFLPLLLSSGDAGRARALVASLALERVVVGEGGLTVDLHLDLPEPRPAPGAPSGPEPPLLPEEIARWETTWRTWDGLLTFLVKRSGSRSDEALRAEMREVLLDARHGISEILEPSHPPERDPVRPLFLDTWSRLADILRRLSMGLPGEEAFRYLALVTAGDAYAALDELGPDYGIELSSDGLRRLARMLDPAPVSEPTAWSDAVDPELRDLFGFGAPPAVPEPSEPEPEAPSGEPGASLRRPGWSLLLVSTAAGERSLDSWVPSHRDLSDYLPSARELLASRLLFVQRKKRMSGSLAPTFRALVLATAWQESCWRHVIRRGGAVGPLTSSVGAVGIMQVNPHVWRGLYDVKALRSSARYNAEAGSEIVHHYLVDYAIAKGEDRARGRAEDLARAAYSAYNAGPRQLTRYRRPGKGPDGVGHPIDADFWTKYQQVRSGDELGVRTCFPGASA
jgi:hypothetical protein